MTNFQAGENEVFSSKLKLCVIKQSLLGFSTSVPIVTNFQAIVTNFQGRLWKTQTHLKGAFKRVRCTDAGRGTVTNFASSSPVSCHFAAVNSGGKMPAPRAWTVLPSWIEIGSRIEWGINFASYGFAAYVPTISTREKDMRSQSEEIQHVFEFILKKFGKEYERKEVIMRLGGAFQMAIALAEDTESCINAFKVYSCRADKLVDLEKVKSE